MDHNQVILNKGALKQAVANSPDYLAEPSVVFTELNCTHKKVGIACLNKPSVLNGLSLDMCIELKKRFIQWESDPEIALVILMGSGDKAFCAGGDLHSLYQSFLETKGDVSQYHYARDFFSTEYSLDYLIHTYKKPVLCWGNGYVMGGGVGLYSGASHKVLSINSKIAMPEITIGLFPDVGGSWLLNHFPGKLGLFLGLTGAQINAQDALQLAWANHCIDASQWHEILMQIQQTSWSSQRNDNDCYLDQVLNRFSVDNEQLDEGLAMPHLPLINQLCQGHDLNQIRDNIVALQGHENKWLQKAATGLQNGPPISAALVWFLQKYCLHKSLAQVFQIEFMVAMHCCANGHFQEGIRALLIDKDKSPIWALNDLSSINDAYFQRYLSTPDDLKTIVAQLVRQ